MSAAPAPVGVIGGSGFYAFLDGAAELHLPTPYGPPSDPVVMATVGDRPVAFLPRHGADHRFPPHRIPYRANLWALRSLGVRQLLTPCAVGGLRAGLAPGALVVPDQLVDRTSGRAATFHDSGAVHVSFADPYCPRGRAVAVTRARQQGWAVTDGGTMVVIEGPRFSTRAESRWFAGQGWSVVNMTGYPEAVLARELGMCCTSLALVTDLDAGLTEGAGVSQSEVFATFAESTGRLRTLLHGIVAALPREPDCACGAAFDGFGDLQDAQAAELPPGPP